MPDELLVLPTPDNCSGDLRLEAKWDEEANYVDFRLVGTRALQPSPTVHRTEGVDFFPNQFWPEQKDFVNGRYLLWIIMNGELLKYYYDPMTLDLLGSEYDFPTPPANAIVLELPGFQAIPTAFFQPKANGDVDFTHRFRYDGLVRGDLPQYAHNFGTLIPHNLCKAHPTRYDLTSTRPYSTKPVPASEAQSFSDYLRAGLIFDITIEPPEYYTDPPYATNVATYSNLTLAGGAVPKGWTADLEAMFSNNAPAIRPWSGAASCTPFFKPVRNRDFNRCAPAGQ